MATPRTSERVESLLAEMTLAEKVGQMVGTPPVVDVDELTDDIAEHHLGSVHFGGTPHDTPAEMARVANAAQRTAVEESRLGVPLFVRAMAEHGHTAIAGATGFPQQLGLAATRNPDLASEVAETAATEMRATGVQSTSSPIGDVARDQRWGRITETYGESPYLSARFVEAMVEGYQDPDLAADDSVLAVTKHFPMYSEGVRGEDAAPNDVSRYSFRRVHLPSYTAGIDAGTGGIMPCYNAIDGEPVHGSERILTDLLREELGFDGFVLADYTGAEDLHRGHGVTDSLEESLYRAVDAGIDLLPSGGVEYAEIILDLAENGALSEERIEASARRVLRAKERLGLFEDPYVDVDAAPETLGHEDHRETAREAARQSMTLLKNEDEVLPLDDADLLVTGPTADDISYQHGGWGVTGDDPAPLGDTLLEGIRSVASDGASVTYEQGADITERIDVDAARTAAEGADVAVVALGEPDYIHEFAGSTYETDPEEFPTRTQLTLPDAQKELVQAVHDTGTPTVVVFVTGRVLATPWVADNVPGILMAYQPGSEGGAVADVLFGDADPSGRLPISVPRSEGQLPVRFNHLPHPRRHGGPTHAESYDPLFEYGHGLSYTDFEYEDLTVTPDEIGPGGSVTVEVTVANVGDRPGVEPVEVFVRDRLSSRVTPVRELVGLGRVELDASERTTVEIDIDGEQLGVVDPDGGSTVESGAFDVFVEDLSAEFRVDRRFD